MGLFFNNPFRCEAIEENTVIALTFSQWTSAYARTLHWNLTFWHWRWRLLKNEVSANYVYDFFDCLKLKFLVSAAEANFVNKIELKRFD